LWSSSDGKIAGQILDAIGDAKPALTPFLCGCQEAGIGGRLASLQIGHVDAVAGAAHLMDQLSAGHGRVGVVSNFGATSRSVIESVLGTGRMVPLLVTGDASSDELARWIALGHAADVDYFIADIGFDLCSNFAASLKQVKPDAVVVGVFCDWDATGPAEGWYSTGVGFNPTTRPNDNGGRTIITRLSDAAHKTVEGADARWGADLFLLVRIINSVGGPDNATSARVINAIRNYKGPVPLLGDVDCSSTGKAAAITPGNCQSTIPAYRYVNGVWVDQGPISALRAPS
jgi:hypothetical protein